MDTRMGATGEVDLSSPALVCTENRLRWDLSPEQIRQMSDELITNTKKVLATVGSLDLDRVTFNNTLKALADMEAEYYVQRKLLDLLRDLSPSIEVRTASTEAYEKLYKFEKTFMSMTVTIYKRILALGLKEDGDSLSAEDKRYVEMRAGKSFREIQSEMEMIKRLSDLTITKAVAPRGIRIRSHATKAKKYEAKQRAEQIPCINMAPSAEMVSDFLEELAHKLKPLGDKERANLLKLKEDECWPFYGGLCKEDLEYYKAQVTKNQYGVDHDQLKEYFPLEVVTQGLLDICQDLLGLSFSLVHGAPVWHPDVTLYLVTDRASGETVGQVYLDLFSREGKSMKLAPGYCSTIQPGCLLSDGRRQIVVAAVVTEFSKPMADAPCLLKHSDVKTLFHEFGHAMHFLCAQVDYAKFNAFNVGRYFVEAPSQMLENWVWEKEPLQRISKHYKTGAPIPDDLLDKLIESRLANIGMNTLQWIVWAKLDQAHHTPDGDLRSKNPYVSLEDSISEEHGRLSEEILGVPVSQRTDITAHLKAWGPGAYRYLWSQVYSMDMFYSRFKQEGIMNPKVGLDYRNCILKPGASKDAEEMLKNFLGREPNEEAFFLSRGIAVSRSRQVSSVLSETLTICDHGWWKGLPFRNLSLRYAAPRFSLLSSTIVRLLGSPTVRKLFLPFVNILSKK